METDIKDPRALHDFASFLHSHIHSIKDETSAFKRNIKHLISLQDKRYQEFINVFEIAMKDIDEFLAAAEKQKRYIKAKAESADFYLRR